MRTKLLAVVWTLVVLGILAVGYAASDHLGVRDATSDVDRRAVETITPAPTPTYTPSTRDPLAAWYRVVKVVDGDTLKVKQDGEVVTVRLIGVDTPETRHPSKPVQCYGPEATAEAKRLVAASRGEVQLDYDLSQDAKDRYGRELAYVWLHGDRSLNEQLIRRGFGREYTYDVPYRHQRWFLQAQLDAHDARRGLWGKCDVEASER